MSQIAKAVALISGVGVVGGVGAYSAGLFTKENPKPTQEIKTVNFKAKLAEEGFELITDTTEGNWTGILEAYKASINNSFSGTKEEDKTIDQLKANCDSHLDKVIENNYRENKDYQKLTQWCVKKTTMDKVLEKAGFRILKFATPTETGEKKLLDTKVKALAEKNKDFQALKKATGTAIGDSDPINIETLKKGCEGLKTSATETIKDEFFNNFYLAKEFCFVKK